MPQTLAEYPRLLLARKSEIAYVYKRGLRTWRWTYRQLAELSFQFARELEARSIGKGERVMLWGENSAEWVAAFFGCMLRGAVAVPMDRIAAPDFMQRVASDVDAKLAVCSTALIPHAGNRPWMEMENLVELLQQHSAGLYQPAEFSRDDTAQIVFTS